MAEAWDLPEALITAIADHHRPGERAPAAVEAVAYVPHGPQPETLTGLKGYCVERLGVQEEVLDGMIEHASREALSLGESMTGRPAGPSATAGAA